MSLATFPSNELAYNVDIKCEPCQICTTLEETAVIETSDHLKNTSELISKRSKNKMGVKNNKNEPENICVNKNPNKEEYMKKRREEFLEKGIMTALYGTVEQKVQCACKSTDQLLAQKRTKLRELLLAEEVAYTAEYVSLCQRNYVARKEELRQRAFETKAKVEKERKEFAEQQLLIQKVLSCDAARPTLTQKKLLELKQDQLWQIKEKYALQEAKKEEERMYHDFMIKNIMAMKKNEEEIAKLNWIKQKNAQQVFLEQIKLNEQKKKEEKNQLKNKERLEWEQQMKNLKDEMEREKEEKRRKKVTMKAEICELLKKEKEIKERRKREEEEIDKTFNMLLRIEEEKEKRKETSNKANLKKQRDEFLANSREMKRKREEEERKFDILIEQLNEKKRLQKEKERAKEKIAKKELFMNVLKGREEQLKEKIEKEKREGEQEQREWANLILEIEKQNLIHEDYERKCAEQRKIYRRQLLDQIQEAQEKKKKQNEKDAEYQKTRRAQEEKEINEVKTLLSTISLADKDHPIKLMIKNSPAKYACPYTYI